MFVVWICKKRQCRRARFFFIVIVDFFFLLLPVECFLYKLFTSPRDTLRVLRSNIQIKRQIFFKIQIWLILIHVLNIVMRNTMYLNKLCALKRSNV